MHVGDKFKMSTLLTGDLEILEADSWKDELPEWDTFIRIVSDTSAR